MGKKKSKAEVRGGIRRSPRASEILAIIAKNITAAEKRAEIVQKLEESTLHNLWAEGNNAATSDDVFLAAVTRNLGNTSDVRLPWTGLISVSSTSYNAGQNKATAKIKPDAGETIYIVELIDSGNNDDVIGEMWFDDFEADGVTERWIAEDWDIYGTVNADTRVRIWYTNSEKLTVDLDDV